MTMRVKVEWHGKLATERGHAGAAHGLHRAAEHVLELSQRLVPIGPTGDLSRSGTVDVDEGNLKASVSYDTPYACRQHEELTWHHTRPGAQAKYLEQPVNEHGTKAEVERIIGEEIDAALGGP